MALVPLCTSRSVWKAILFCWIGKYDDKRPLMHFVVLCRLGKGNGIAEENHSSDTLQLLLSNKGGTPHILHNGRQPRKQAVAVVP